MWQSLRYCTVSFSSIIIGKSDRCFKSGSKHCTKFCIDLQSQFLNLMNFDFWCTHHLTMLYDVVQVMVKQLMTKWWSGVILADDDIHLQLHHVGAIVNLSYECKVCQHTWSFSTIGDGTRLSSKQHNAQILSSILFTGSQPSKVMRCVSWDWPYKLVTCSENLMSAKTKTV